MMSKRTSQNLSQFSILTSFFCSLVLKISSLDKGSSEIYSIGKIYNLQEEISLKWRESISYKIYTS